MTAAERDRRTGFRGRSATAPLPGGARSAQVTVAFLDSSTPPGGEPEPSGPACGLLDNLALTVSAPLPAARLAPPPSAVPRFRHVFMIMMENTNGSAVLRRHSHMPFLHGLMAQVNSPPTPIPPSRSGPPRITSTFAKTTTTTSSRPVTCSDS